MNNVNIIVSIIVIIVIEWLNHTGAVCEVDHWGWFIRVVKGRHNTCGSDTHLIFLSTKTSILPVLVVDYVRFIFQSFHYQEYDKGRGESDVWTEGARSCQGKSEVFEEVSRKYEMHFGGKTQQKSFIRKAGIYNLPISRNRTYTQSHPYTPTLFGFVVKLMFIYRTCTYSHTCTYSLSFILLLSARLTLKLIFTFLIILIRLYAKTTDIYLLRKRLDTYVTRHSRCVIKTIATVA